MATSAIASSQREALDAAEARAGVDALDELLAERHALMIGDITGWDPAFQKHAQELLARYPDLTLSLAALRARHGSFGTYEAERKIQWTSIAVEYRDRHTFEGEDSKGKPKMIKPAEAEVEQVAHADGKYVGWVTLMNVEKRLFNVLEDRFEAITQRINRDQAILRYLSSEPK